MFVTACNDSLKSKTLNVNAVCATCEKCMFNSNHDACISKFIHDMNARTKKPKVVHISTRKLKSQANKSVATPPKKTVALESTIQKSKSYYRMLYEKTSKAWKWWIEQQCPSGYKWVSKTKMKWVPKVSDEVDLKAQLQDKNIAINELKKLIEKCKGKPVETKFDKPFVVRQSNAQRIPKPSVLGKSTLFSDSLERKSFSKPKSVLKTNVSEGFSKPVTTQILPQTARQAIVQLILFIVDYGYTKHMTGNLKLLCNFVEKYLGTVRFGNDQFALILGYGDLVQGNITINMVYYVEGLNHNLFSVGQFCDANLEVAFWKSTCFVRDLQGNDLLTDYINLLSNKDIMIGLPKLKYVKDQLCSSCEVSKAKRSSFKTKAEAIETACYTQNRSIIIPTHEKTAYHIINDRKPSIRHLHIFGCTCYLTRDGENLDKMKEKGDPCILASDYDNSDLAPQLQNVSPSTDTTAPSQQELDLLFGPLYDEFFTAGTSSVNKSSSPTDNSKQQDTPPITNIQSSTKPTAPTNVNAEENNDNQVVDTKV
ncbi:hypothetical protein Tco_0356998 [Tanacetum coccineum]